jgi:hypothetical protein
MVLIRNLGIFLTGILGGLNSTDKNNEARAKIEESACSIFCIQESKI